MKMKKLISSITAAVIASTTVLTSALVAPITTFMASAATVNYGSIAYLSICSNNSYYMEGGTTYWDDLVDVTSVTLGDVAVSADYFATDVDSAHNQYAICQNWNTAIPVSDFTGGAADHFTSDDAIKITFELTRDLSSPLDLNMNVQAYGDANLSIWSEEEAGSTLTVQKAGTYVLTYNDSTVPVETETTTATTEQTTTVETSETTTASTEATTTSETTSATTAPAIKDVELTDLEVKTEIGNDGTEYSYVDFDPAGAISATLYYKVTSNDDNTSGSFGTYNENATPNWQQVNFTDIEVPANKEVTVDYDIPANVGETVKASVYWPGVDGVTIEKVVLHYSEVVTTTSATTATTTEASTTPATTTSASSETVTSTSTAASTEATVTSSDADTSTSTAATTVSSDVDTTVSTAATTVSADTDTTASTATNATVSSSETVASTTRATTVSTIGTEAPKGEGIIMDIDETVVEPGEEYAELGVNVSNGIKSLGINCALDIPEVTAKILKINVDYTGNDILTSNLNATPMKNLTGFESYINGDSSITEDMRRVYVAWTTTGAAFDIPDGQAFNLTFDIADNAIEIAEEAGLTLQHDADGYYYDFPVNWAPDVMHNWDWDGTHGSAYILPNLQYLNDQGSGTDIHTTDVTYYSGALRIYTDAAPITTTSTSKEMPINYDIDEVFAYPGDECTLNIDVTSSNGVKSAGLKGVINFSLPTFDAIDLAYEDDSSVTNFGNKNMVNLKDFMDLKAGTITDEFGHWIRFSLLQDGVPAADPTGNIMSIDLNVADKDTIQQLADEAGLTLQTGVYEGKEVTYYEFPVDWAPYGTDLQQSGNQMIPVDRYQYLDEDQKDIFTEQVGLKSGAVRVIMGEPETTTTAATTTTTTTTTTSATTTTTASTTARSTTTSASTTRATTTSATTTESTTTRATTTRETVPTTTTTVVTTVSTSESTTESTTTSTTTSATTTTTSTTTTSATTSTTASTTSGSTTSRTRVTMTYTTTTTSATTEESSDTTTSESTTESTTTEPTTTSSDATTSTTTSTTTSETTTSSEITFPIGTTSITVELKADAGFYFSEDTRDFNPADLLTAYAVDEEGQQVDVTADVVFEYATPQEMYDALGEAYCAAELTAYYVNEDGERIELSEIPTVYIGVKGDTNLNGEVEIPDSYATLMYSSEHAVGNNDYTFTDGEDANLEKLVYFLSDINTESKEGADTDDKLIEIPDAYNILMHNSYDAVGDPQTWPEHVPSLTKLEGSCWYVG